MDGILTLSQILGGFTSGFLYVGETAAMLSYPHQNDRGYYLGGSAWILVEKTCL
jgi:hypothetical protein